MPIYEYRCARCLAINEFLVGVGQGDIEIKCQYCGSNELNRIFSQSNVVMGKGGIGLRNGKTCCGKDERCEKPPCSDDGECTR